MASGHVNRIKEPNTWLHRPMLQNREESSCQPGATSTHGTILAMSAVRSLTGVNRTSLGGHELAQNDPKPARLTERPHAAKILRLLPAASYDTI